MPARGLVNARSLRYSCLGFIQPNTGQIVPWQFAKDGEKITYAPQAKIEINHAESLIHAAVTGAGIIQLLSLSLNPSIAAGLLTPILDGWSTVGPSVSVIYPQNRHLSAKVRVFVDFVSQLFSKEAKS